MKTFFTSVDFCNQRLDHIFMTGDKVQEQIKEYGQISCIELIESLVRIYDHVHFIISSESLEDFKLILKHELHNDIIFVNLTFQSY